MNLPNKITVFRLFLIPVFVALYSLGDLGWLYAGLVFVLASFTDFLDGYLARKYGLTSTFGAFLDPVADKILVIASLVLLAARGIVPDWSVILIIARETLINGFRLIAVDQGVVISASYMGKIKTVTQMAGLTLLLFSPAWAPLRVAGLVVYWIAVVATVVSGIEYLYQGRDLISDREQA